MPPAKYFLTLLGGIDGIRILVRKAARCAYLAHEFQTKTDDTIIDPSDACCCRCAGMPVPRGQTRWWRTPPLPYFNKSVEPYHNQGGQNMPPHYYSPPPYRFSDLLTTLVCNVKLNTARRRFSETYLDI